MGLSIKHGPFSLQNDNEEMPYEFAKVMHFQKSFEEIVKRPGNENNMFWYILDNFGISKALFYSKEIVVSLHLTLKEMNN